MIETALSFFALGTIGFYIILTIVSILCIIGVETETYGLAAFFTITFTLAYWKSISALNLGWQFFAIALSSYAVGGILWSIYKWHAYVRGIVKEAIATNQKRDSIKYDVSVSRNKGKIVAWIAYWPWSLLWSLTGDFFNFIYENVSNVYEKITKNALNKLPE
jgi:hypothetical protein